jgi:hypothetical protein
MTAPAAIEFGAWLEPPLGSGRVTVTATQTVTAPGGQGETFEATQSLLVKGARYQLDDAAVDSVFPPAGSQGEFANLLAHVVLNQPTLPWQRLPGQAGELGAGSPPARGTWLGLLLFDETDPPPAPRTVRLAELATAETVFFPPSEPEGEGADDSVTVIDVPCEQFAARAPALADLQWTAHTRHAATGAKAAAHGAAPAGDFAVVLGTRLPAPGRVSTVHLVSLEGYGPYLPSGDGAASPRLPGGVSAVRLVTLRSWTFSTVALKESFEGHLRGLNLEPAGLQLPYKKGSGAADAAVANAFGLGYTALDHALRDGSTTVSWYRGPLVPLGARRQAFTSRESADELLRYDPETGMFDVSYSVAWELGRLLGLHDRAYATALYRWKLTITKEQAEQLERELIDASLPPAPDDHPDDGHLLRAVTQVLAPGVASLAAGQVATPRPTRAPPRLHRDALAGRLRAPQAALRADPPRGTDERQVIDWLTQLHLLHGVPFNHLVPDTGMLPSDSIRFFELDFGWVEALLDGAFSLGTTAPATAVARALRPAAVASARSRLTRVRRDLLSLDAGETAEPEALSGFLLRSAAVSGWPGMEVHAFADTDAAHPLDTVRLERVAPAVLLGLFGGILARVDFREPAESLHFGVDGEPGAWARRLRYADGEQIGSENGASVPVTIRPVSANVVAVDTLAGAMSDKVWSGDSRAFTAAEFALEMVQGAEVVSFQVGR